jgi:hypothetical protein
LKVSCYAVLLSSPFDESRSRQETGRDSVTEVSRRQQSWLFRRVCGLSTLLVRQRPAGRRLSQLPRPRDGGVTDMHNMVQVHITDSLPMQVRALSYADRIEIRFGKAFPAVLIIDGSTLDRLADAIQDGRDELAEAATPHADKRAAL